MTCLAGRNVGRVFFGLKYEYTLLLLSYMIVNNVALAKNLVAPVRTQGPASKLNSCDLNSYQEQMTILKEEVDWYEDNYGGSDETMESYKLSYHESISSMRPKKFNAANFQSTLDESRFLLVGDNHLLGEDEALFISLVDSQLSQRPVAIVMEAISTHVQAKLDSWLNGRILDNNLRKAIEFEKHWGFEWEYTFSVLKFAKENNIKVYGLEDRRHPGDLHERDEKMKDRILDVSKENPQALIATIVGNLHVLGEDHLYEKLDNSSDERTLAVVNEHWDLYDKKLENMKNPERASAFELTKSVYYISYANPLLDLVSNFMFWGKIIGTEDEHKEFLRENSISEMITKLLVRPFQWRDTSDCQQRKRKAKECESIPRQAKRLLDSIYST